jgi:predicted RNA binding protein YcfA (HicA-like mRNA interferase family)
MTDRRPKLLAKLAANPKEVSPDFLETVLAAFGYMKTRASGSHRTYTKEGAYPITVPYRRPHVKRFYVEAVMVRLRAELEDEEGT